MRWLIIFVTCFVLSCAGVLTPPLGDSVRTFEQVEAPAVQSNSVTLKNLTPFDLTYVIVRTGPNYAPFFIGKNVRYRGWIKAGSQMRIEGCPIGHYWAVFKMPPGFANLEYSVDAVEPTVIELTYNARKLWVNYGV